MPARDKIHEIVKTALIKDGWTITHDPYIMMSGIRKVFVDLGAEKPFAAEKGSKKILVEVKSFTSNSEVRDLELAIGQFDLYQAILKKNDPERHLYIAMPEVAFRSVFDTFDRDLLESLKLAIITIHSEREEIVQWHK